MENKLRTTFSGWQLTNPLFYEGLTFSIHNSTEEAVLVVQGHGGNEALPMRQRRDDDNLG